MDNLFNSLVPKQALRNFQPRFDVREEQDAFRLQGELPGVDPKELTVEFVDRNTMIVKGRTVSQSEHGNRPEATEQQQAAVQDKGKEKAIGTSEPEASGAANDAMETEPTSRPSTPGSTSSNYHKATVEETRDEADGDFVDVAAETSTPTIAQDTTGTTPAEQISSHESTHTTAAPATEAKQQQDSSYYWVSERSVGEFKRSFRFPGQVDQENVKASLKDGLLEVIVPKAKEVRPRRINIE